jgi:hypothetical protein
LGADVLDHRQTWKEAMMTGWGYVLLIAGALAIGLVTHYLATQQVGAEWTLASVGAVIGGFFASEYSMGGLGAWGTEVAGMYIYPALIGAILLAGIVEVAVHFTTEQTEA